MKKKSKKNKKNHKMIGSVIFLSLLIIGAIALDIYLHIDHGEYVNTLKKYMSYIETNNYEAMYEMLTEESKSQISQEDFILKNQKIYDGIEAKNITVSNVTVNQEKTEISYVTTMNTIAGRVEFSNTIPIQKNGEEYQIQWSSTIIFPELKDGYKVKVNTENAKRGNIFDRNGNVLAGEGIASSVGLVPGKMSDDKEKSILKISNLLGIEPDFIRTQLSQSYVKEDTFVPLKTIEKSNKELKEQLLQIKGIMITDKKTRNYPLGEAASQMLGYVQIISAEELTTYQEKGYTSSSFIGKTGLERVYENTLHGTDGCEVCIYDEKGNKIKTLAQVLQKDGKDITLTIDSYLQQVVYDQFQKDKSATVVMNPKTGEILALVSTPTYNSNDFSLGMLNEKWQALNQDENKPLINRYLARYAPGSSFKPIIGAIALSNEKLEADEDLGKSGTSWQKDNSWNDFKVTTLASYSGPANLQNALIYSDNIYFAKVALKIGANDLAKYVKKLGFGENLDFIQTIEKSQISNSGKIDSEKQLANTGYGQAEVLVNPIFMASVYSTFVNEGNMIKPYLEYREKSGNQTWKDNVFTAEASKIIQEDLIQVVENERGTGHQAKMENVVLAGKTGTAEIKKDQNDTNGTEIGWFNAFVVSDDDTQQILVVSLVEDVKNRGGSHYVVPKVKNIIDAYLNP